MPDPQGQFTEVLREWSEVFMGRSMREFTQFMRESGLSMPQFSALFHLRYHGGCGVSDIGGHLGVSNAAASQMIDRLVQQGLLKRSVDPNDRRAKQLRLTPDSQALIEASIRARQRWMEELTTALTPDEQTAIIQALQKLTEVARRLEPARTESQLEATSVASD